MTLLLLASTPAHAGIDVRARIQVDTASVVLLLREVNADTDADATPATVVYDAAGNRCEILMNVDALGEQAFVLVKARCTDRRGRTVLRSDPNILVRVGSTGSVRIGPRDDPAAGFQVDLVVTEDETKLPAIAIRRDVFAEPGRATYRFYRFYPPWPGLACDPGPLDVVEEGDTLWVSVEGRYRAGDLLETRCAADGVEVPVVVRFW